MLRRRTSNLNYRTSAELLVKEIWDSLASQPRIVQIPEWRTNWSVRELLQMPLARITNNREE
jgi:hypothetical protein